METGLKNSTVLITGASGGIGLATAQAFIKEGAKLALHYNTNPDSLSSITDNLDNKSCINVGADLRDEMQVENMFQQILNKFDSIDILVANAGVWLPDYVPIHQMTLDRWNETISVDLTGTFLTCRGFLKQLADNNPQPQPQPHPHPHPHPQKKDIASIVLVGSTAAIFGEANHADYSVAKAGMTYGLTLSLKNEIVQLAARGRVNCVCPGWTDTPMAIIGMEQPGAFEHITSTMPLKKIATPEDIANCIVYLSSDKLAGHISGQIITVAGGMEGRLLRH